MSKIARTLGGVVDTVKQTIGLSAPTKINKNALQNTSRYNAKVDPRLRDILDSAAQRFPGYTVQAISGYRPGDKRQHGKHRATDIQLVDKATGKALPNYQNAKSFRTYEKFAQEARRVQQEKYPELDKAFRWGGYFSGTVKNPILGTKSKYGAVDVMHFDLGGLQGLGMLGGSWAKGLTKAQRGLVPGAESFGIGHIDRAPLGTVTDPNRAGLQSIQDRREYERPSFSAPVGKVTRSTLANVRAPTKTVSTQRTQPRSLMMGAALRGPVNDVKQNFPGMSIPADTASPRTMAKTLGGINSVVGSLADAPVNRTTPKTNRLQQITTAAIAPPAIYDDPRALAYAQNMQPKVGLVPAVPSAIPQTLAQPIAQPKRQPLQITVRTPRQAVAPTMPGGTLGGIRAQDRFSVGTGLQGITAAQGGVRGATGFSVSIPGVSVTSRGKTLGTITRNEKFGTTTFRDPNGNVTGVHLDKGNLGRTLGSIFGGSGSSNAGQSSGSSGGKSSGKSGGARGAAGGGLGQSQRSL